MDEDPRWPVMSVCTKPGCNRATQMHRGLGSTARDFPAAFTAALDMRWPIRPPASLSAIEPMRLVRMPTFPPSGIRSIRAGSGAIALVKLSQPVVLTGSYNFSSQAASTS
jgi:hypothetical protein